MHIVKALTSPAEKKPKFPKAICPWDPFFFIAEEHHNMDYAVGNADLCELAFFFLYHH
jgi:hypothetical protein